MCKKRAIVAQGDLERVTEVTKEPEGTLCSEPSLAAVRMLRKEGLTVPSRFEMFSRRCCHIVYLGHKSKVQDPGWAFRISFSSESRKKFGIQLNSQWLERLGERTCI